MHRSVRPLAMTLALAALTAIATVPAASGAPLDDKRAQAARIQQQIEANGHRIAALGEQYNGARIALSERGRELASLRVLGFTEREVAVMLLGEQALLVALAIPLGWALGWGISWLITWAIDTELMRLPLVISGRTYARASIIIVIAAFLSGLLVIRRLRRLDLIEVLKTRE